MEKLQYFKEPPVVSYYDVNPMKNVLIEPDYLKTKD